MKQKINYDHLTPPETLKLVSGNGLRLEYIKNQSTKICLEAVKNFGFALKYVKEQTREICLAAVKKNGGAIQFVKEQTTEICFNAVKKMVRPFNMSKNKQLKFVWKL